MTTALEHSMFYDVLFPQAAGETDALAEDLFLTRLMRFQPQASLNLADMTFVAFDFETTGLDTEVDRIIEVGAVKIKDGRVIDKMITFVKVGMELTDGAAQITGITHEMLADAPTIATVLPQFLDFIKGSVLVAHNADFDMGMLRSECARRGIQIEWPCFCTLKMARELLPQLENKKLDSLAEHYGLTFESRHRALGDVQVLAGVLNGLFEDEASHLETWADLKPFYAGLPS